MRAAPVCRVLLAVLVSQAGAARAPTSWEDETTSAEASVAEATSSAQSTAAATLPTGQVVLAQTERAAEYYQGNYAHTTLLSRNGWSWSAYADGRQALYRATGEQHYLTGGLRWGRSNSWDISAEVVPDALKAGQTYFDLHAVTPHASLVTMDGLPAGRLRARPGLLTPQPAYRSDNDLRGHGEHRRTTVLRRRPATGRQRHRAARTFMNGRFWTPAASRVATSRQRPAR